MYKQPRPVQSPVATGDIYINLMEDVRPALVFRDVSLNFLQLLLYAVVRV